MAILFILIVFSLGMAFFATQNQGIIHLTIANFYSAGIPVYAIVIGSMLLGIFISWLISLVNSFTSSFRMRKIHTEIRNANRTIDELSKKNAQLVKENTHLKGEKEEQVKDEDTLEQVEEEPIAHPKIFHQQKHSLA